MSLRPVYKMFVCCRGIQIRCVLYFVQINQAGSVQKWSLSMNHRVFYGTDHIYACHFAPFHQSMYSRIPGIAPQ